MEEIDAAIAAAADEHRRKLGSLAACASDIEAVDRQIDELTQRRSELLSTYAGLHLDLTTGKTAGAAIAALGLKVPSSAGGSSRAKQAAPKKSGGSARKPSAGAGTRSAGPDRGREPGAAGAAGDHAPGGSPADEAGGAVAPLREPAAV